MPTDVGDEGNSAMGKTGSLDSVNPFRNERAFSAPTPHLVPRVLIVDDEPSLAEQLSAALTRIGCEAEAVFHGADALELLRCEPFDVLILDWIMPEVDGYKVVESLSDFSNCHWLSNMPLIVHSGLHPADIKLPRSSEKFELIDFLEKPSDRSDLARAVAKALAYIRTAA